MPQVGQTRWGSRGLWHCGHALYVGAAILWFARRLDVRLWDCFCFGTAMRRANHKIAAPTYNACPQCHSPRLPHRVCPTCGTYAGREVVHVHEHDHDHEH